MSDLENASAKDLRLLIFDLQSQLSQREQELSDAKKCVVDLLQDSVQRDLELSRYREMIEKLKATNLVILDEVDRSIPISQWLDELEGKVAK